VQRTVTIGIALFTSACLAGSAMAQCGASKQASAGAHEEAPRIVLASMTHEQDGMDIVDTAVKAGSFKTLAAALKAADLVDALKGAGPFTVFAPTDEAFAKLPPGTVEMLLKPENKAKLTAILKYHVVKGEVKADKVVGLTSADTLNGQRVDVSVKDSVVSIDKARVTKTDIQCSNGVIHVIDTVLTPSTKDVVDTAVDAGSFKTLASLLSTTGLAEALKAEGPFTVFAPTDDAFAKLPKATLEMLAKPESKEKLAGILKLHVVKGRVYADQAAKLHEAATLNGESIAIKKEGKSLMVGGAKVTKADIEASNGVIHVIDTVIMPK